MHKHIRRTTQVRQDIVNIYGYIHERSPQSAERVLEAIERTIKSLGDMPGIGRRWDSHDPRLEGMRVAVISPYRNYLIFYRPVANGIEVYRVVHGAQELERIIEAIEIDFESD